MDPIPFGKPMIGDQERAAVAAVLAGTTLTHGPIVKDFESAFAEFTGAPHAIATASCAASLHLAYMAIDLGPGDEVIVPAQTHVAQAHAVTACGATPVFWESEPSTGSVDVDLLDGLISERTRAISLVHYLGRPLEMERVLELARARALLVVEDCAIALGASVDGTHVGLIGDLGCFSFYPVKHIATGEGGMLITNRDDIAERVEKQRAFGIDKGVITDRRHTGAYNVEHFGLNYRMGEIQAAIGVEQMRRLPGFLEARQRNFDALHAGLSEIDGLTVLDSGHYGGARSSHYCLVAMLEPPYEAAREQVIESLKAKGIGTSVYYPLPLPRTTYYQERAESASDFAISSRISAGSLAFPVGPHVDDQGVERMIESMRDTLSEVARV